MNKAELELSTRGPRGGSATCKAKPSKLLNDCSLVLCLNRLVPGLVEDEPKCLQLGERYCSGRRECSIYMRQDVNQSSLRKKGAFTGIWQKSGVDLA